MSQTAAAPVPASAAAQPAAAREIGVTTPSTSTEKPIDGRDTVAAFLAGTERVLPMEVTVNSTKSGTWLFLERAGVLYASREAFEEWRVELNPSAATIDFKGQPYSPLSAVPGFKAKVNFANQSVDLFFSPEAFSTLRMTNELSKRPVVSPVLPSIFLNYDLNYAASAFRNAGSINDLGLLTELGVSGTWGVLTSSQAGRNLIANDTFGQPRQLLRLETTFTKDFPDENRTLRVGDTTTRAGMWGRNAYFGGIQFGSNFALTPGFIRQPLPVLAGLSAAPSTVELYVNDVLRQVSSVPTGPFALDNFPVMSGSGETRLVVRDILGRETVIVQSFLTTAQLMATGLSDWSVEAGTLRRDLGTASNHYGDGFASGTWSRGINNSLTLEGRAELTRRLRSFGLGVVAALPARLLGRAALAASHEVNVGNGGFWLLGAERQGLHTSASFEVRGASQNFTQLGLDSGVKLAKLQLAASWSASLDNGRSFGAGLASITQFDNSRVSTLSGNFSMRLGERSSLNLSASRAFAGVNGNAVGLNLTMPLSNNRVVSSTVNHQNGSANFYASATQNPGPDSNLGWRVLAGHQQDQARAEVGTYYLGRYGTATGDVSVSRDLKALRLGATGGLVLTDGHLFATRRVDESFAVAEVAGYANVGIGIGSNVLTQTDANGIALIPRLIPYQNNSLRLDPKELPINAEIDSIELTVVPAWRSAVKATFPVRSGRGALLKIVLDDGDVAPAGATVGIDGDKQEFYVARRGEAFVTGLQPVNRLTLQWNNQKCSFDVTFDSNPSDEIARVGPLLCKGVKR
ncbi:fimbria/pilus outer membrane usher protein [Rhodoferax sp.]|uniref:fimbria/pilus outer membrane usher protein n=1 Tax=Rhodoferax sp. TaxID=50421 RepID=UPI00374CB43B